MAGGRGRGNAKQFTVELKKMADEFLSQDLSKAAVDIALEVRQRAEDFSRDRMGSQPGAPDIASGWFAGPVLLDSSELVGGHERSVAALSAWRPGESIFIWNPVFYAYFHEKGYYSKGGGARPKWMLRDALVASENTEHKL